MTKRQIRFYYNHTNDSLPSVIEFFKKYDPEGILSMVALKKAYHERWMFEMLRSKNTKKTSEIINVKLNDSITITYTHESGIEEEVEVHIDGTSHSNYPTHKHRFITAIGCLNNGKEIMARWNFYTSYDLLILYSHMGDVKKGELLSLSDIPYEVEEV